MSSRESEPVLNAMRDVEFSDRGAAERRALADRLTATQGDAHELTAGELQAIIILIRQHCTVCKPGTLPRLVPRLEAMRDEAERALPPTE